MEEPHLLFKIKRITPNRDIRHFYKMYYLATHKSIFPGQLAVAYYNHLVLHPKKCEAMMLLRGSFIGPLNALTLYNQTIK